MNTPRWEERFARFLNPRRQRYAWIAGAAMWVAWLTSLLLGSGVRDAAGQVLGPDFLAFYTGGRLIASEQSGELYNLRLQHQVQQSIAGEEWKDLTLYVNPPFYAWLFVPFTWLPYKTAALLWMALGMLLAGAGVRALGLPAPARVFIWLSTFYPFFAGVIFGQNSSLSLALMCFSFALWKREKRFAAGLAASLLLYKPQLAIGLGLLWLLDWRKEWRTLAGLAVGGAVLAGISFIVTPAASLGYIQAAPALLSDYPPWHAYATRTFWINLLPGAPILADVLYFLGVFAGLGLFIRFRQRTRGQRALHFAAAIGLMLWVTPHLMVYDWSLLLLPAVILWYERPRERNTWLALFALIWVAAFLSGPLVLAQTKALPASLQLSLPAFAIAGWLAANRAMQPPAADGAP